MIIPTAGIRRMPAAGRRSRPAVAHRAGGVPLLLLAAFAAAVVARPAAADDVHALVSGTGADPLRGTEKIDPATTGPDAMAATAALLPPRTDTAFDWRAPLEPLHHCGEPRLLPTCVPPPPCHPSLPPHPFDLVGVRGGPTCGPIYRGPCAPRTGSRDDGPHPRLHRVHDRLFDWFYTPRTPIFP